MHKFIFKAFLIQCVLMYHIIGSAQTFTQITTGSVVNSGGDSRATSWVDYDNDGDIDLYIANQSNQDNFFYQNNGGLLTQISSLATAGFTDATGNAWGDYNNDGYIDLFLSDKSGNNHLFTNNTSFTFNMVTSGNIVNDGGTSQCASWGDYDNDGYIDLVVANRSNENNFLYHNNGNGTFTKITTGPVVNDGGDSKAAIWGDYDDDGFIDLFIANYSNQSNFLYHNNGNGTFTKVTTGPVVSDFNDSFCANWIDYDNDLDLDLFIGNKSSQYCCLYQNNGNGTFTKITTGILVNDPSEATSSTWGDVDNDGDYDVFVANGNTSVPWANMLYLNNGNGTFNKVFSGAIVNDYKISTSASFGDMDADGFLDLAVANRSGQDNLLYRNDGNSNNWINLFLVGLISNRSAFGAKVYVSATINGQPMTMFQEVTCETGYKSQNSINLEYGLGDANIIDTISIHWPSGLICTYYNVPVDTFLTYYEACGTLVAQTTGNSPNCPGSCDGMASVSASGGNTPYTFLWGNGSTDSTASGLCAGLYYVTVSDSGGANFIDSVTITDPPAMNLNMYGYDTQCGQSDGSALVSVSGGTSPYTYYWSTGGTMNIITGLDSGTYYVTVMDAGGCPDTASVSVQSIGVPPNVITSNDTTICRGDTVSLSASGADTYAWNTGDTGPVVNVIPQQTQQFVVISSGACGSVYDTILVTVIGGANADAGGDTVIGPGGEAPLFASGGTSYYWSPGNTLSCGNCAEPVAYPGVTTTYYVWIVDANGCAVQDSVKVEVLDGSTSGCTDQLFMPNIFSPNGDDNNDILLVYGDDFDVLSFQIFDRWGNLVFETDDKLVGWDGKQDGKSFNSAVFVWQIEAYCKLDGNTFYKKGNVTLVR